MPIRNVFSPVTTRSRQLARSDIAAVTVALVGTLAGCAAAPVQQSGSTSTPQSSQELRSLSQDALGTILTASAQKHLVPDALALITTPEGTVSASYGRITLEGNRQPLVSDIFRIGSVTKTMVAAAILQQVGEQKLALSDPISQFVADVPNGENITIANLLQMRSGLHNYLDTDGFAAVFNDDMTHIWTPEELVAFGFGEPTVSDPADAFDYIQYKYDAFGPCC